LEQMNRLLGQLSAGGLPHELAGALLRHARDLFGAHLAFVIWSDVPDRPLGLLAVDGEPFAHLIPAGLSGGKERIEQLFADHGAHRIDDSREERDAPEYFAAMNAAGLYSVLRAPLLVRGAPCGRIVLWGEG